MVWKWFLSVFLFLLPLPCAQAAPQTGEPSRLEVLADKQELQELALRYARAVDRKDFDRLARLYHPDAHHAHGGMFAGRPADFIIWLKKSMVNMDTQHLVANSLFEIDGDTAKGEIYTINFHHFPATNSNYVAGGRYLDRYVWHEGRWVFKERTRVIDWSEERPANPGATGASLLRGSALPHDPSRSLEPFFTD